MALADKVAELKKAKESKDTGNANEPITEQITLGTVVKDYSAFDRIYKPIYRDLFEFHRKHCFVSEDDGWAKLVDEFGKLQEKHKHKNSDFEFVVDLIVATVTSIERQYKSINED